MARHYVVQAKDTLSEIAQRFYGDASLFKALANANEIADPNKIKAGEVLVLPDSPGRWYPVTITSSFEDMSVRQTYFDLTIPAGMRLVIETVSGMHTARNWVLPAAQLWNATSGQRWGYFPWAQCGPEHPPPEAYGLPQFKERFFGFNYSVRLYVDGPLGTGPAGLQMTCDDTLTGDPGAYLFGEYTLSGYLELRSDF